MKGKFPRLFKLAMALALVAGLVPIMAVPASALTTGVVTPSPASSGSLAEYRVTFVHTLAAAPGSVISLTFPAGTTVPATISKSLVRVGTSDFTLGSAAAAIANAIGFATADPDIVVEGRTVRIALPALLEDTEDVGTTYGIDAGDYGAIIISQLAGLKNPTISYNGSYTVSIASSVPTEATVTSAPYTITGSPTRSPTSGGRGTSVTISGTFTANLSVVVTHAVSGIVLASGLAGADGTVSLSFSATVPPFTPGSNSITATDGLGNVGTTSFILNPSISLSPTSGPVGSTVTITYRDATPNIAASSTLFGALTPNTTHIAQTTAAGSFTVGVPTGLLAGDVRVTVTDSVPRTATATFTVIGSPVTLTPSSGVVGTRVTISGSQFTPGAGSIGISTTDGITFAGSVWNTTAVDVDTAGNFLTTWTTVDLSAEMFTPGTYTVRVNDGVRNGVATFTVPSRTITVSPTSGVRGSYIVVTGTGFRVSGLAIINFAGVPQVVATADASGNFTSSFAVPPVAVAGAYTVTAVDTAVSALNASATFTVPGAAITVSPTSGGAGSYVVVSGTGFPAFATLAAGTGVTIGGLPALPAAAATDSTGNFTVSVMVPALTVGPTTVVATISTTTASASLTVTAAPVTPALALAGIAGKYSRVWGFDSATQTWKLYDPAVLAISDLTVLTRGQGYWIKVTQACTLIYRGNSYTLNVGWNLIGWLD